MTPDIDRRVWLRQQQEMRTRRAVEAARYRLERMRRVLAVV